MCLLARMEPALILVNSLFYIEQMFLLEHAPMPRGSLGVPQEMEREDCRPPFMIAQNVSICRR